MKRISSFINSVISYILAETFIKMFAGKWTRFVRNVNARKLFLRGESVLGRTFLKKKHGKVKAIRYERGANGQIRKAAA